MTDRVLIVDFGSQVTQLIARRVREMGVYCEIHPFNKVTAESIEYFGPQGVILSGGPASVSDPDGPTIPPVVLELGVPILGICYGVQSLIHRHGGGVTPSDTREFGRAEVSLLPSAPGTTDLFSRIRDAGPTTTVWMSHSDRIDTLPEDFKVTARTENGVIAAVAHTHRPIFGVQFHPEVVHTTQGKALIDAFLFDSCKLSPSWTAANFVEESCASIREKVGPHERVILGLSGGVDSSVAALLLHRAIGDRLQCIFVDNGLMRRDEGREVVATFRDHYRIPLRAVDASERFLEALKGITDPEEKRRRIGHVFVEIFEAEASTVDGARWLAQGTLYPDVIESQSFRGPSATIKTHHNVGGLPEDMALGLIEPLRELFKDEVRAVGISCGLPDEMVWRQPFPGPGLAVRILGEVTPERVKLLQEADAIVREELEASREALVRAAEEQAAAAAAWAAKHAG